MNGNAIDAVVKRDLCIGCGTCAAACPRKQLVIDWDDRGCYVARETGDDCRESCSLCLKVCPFADGNPNEDDLSAELYGRIDGVSRSPELGYFRACWAGHSLLGDQRASGASGGMATWFLTRLLQTGAADRVLCVAQQPGTKPLFKYVTRTTEEDVERSARSSYYPVEMSEVLADIMASEGKSAVVCLPCFAKALRLASNALPGLREKLACVVGIVCGHGVSAFFAEYAAAIADEGAGFPRTVTFRTKTAGMPATEIGTECAWDSADGSETRTVHWSQGLGEAWSGHWFTPNPCLYCDDLFAETADVAFMDAWLDEYVPDHRGTSLVIARSESAAEMLRAGMSDGSVHLESCPPDRVILSQEGALDFKRRRLSYRLWLAEREGRPAPRKRVEPRGPCSIYDSVAWRAEMRAARYGPVEWQRRADLSSFTHRMRARCSTRRELIGHRWLGMPGRALRRLGRRTSAR